jgi:hypothetical protein
MITFIQSTPASTWTITHNLGHLVATEVMINEGSVLTKVLPANVTATVNSVTITFSSPQTGEVRYVAGSN